MNRLGAAVLFAVLAAALFAWWVKGELEMGWLYVGPAIVAVTVVMVGLASLTLPAGFPRFAAALAALPYGMLLAWVAASTPSTWTVPPAAGRMAEAREIARDTERLDRIARDTMRAPVQIGTALVDSTDGFTQKISGSFGFRRREPVVRIVASFAVGPYEPLRLSVAPDGSLTVLDPVPDAARTVIRPGAITDLFPETPLVEVGGTGPHAPGRTVPMRLMRAEDDWSIAIVRVLADGEPLQTLRTWSRDEIDRAIRSALAAAGVRPVRITTYFRPAGDRVMFMQAPAFDFLAPLEGRGLGTVRAALAGDSLTFDVVSVRR